MTGRPVPRVAAVPGYAAVFVVQQLARGGVVTSSTVREHGLWLRAQGRTALADQLAAGWAQITAAADDFRARSAAPHNPPAPAAAAGCGNAQTETRPVRAESSPSDPMTSKEAATMLGISERRVLQLRAAGTLTGRKAGRSWLLDAAPVRALADAREVAA